MAVPLNRGHSVFVDLHAVNILNALNWGHAFCLSRCSRPNPWGIYGGLPTGDGSMRLEILVQRLLFCNAGARQHVNTQELTTMLSDKLAQASAMGRVRLQG
jgi:hypothetical protein